MGAELSLVWFGVTPRPPLPSTHPANAWSQAPCQQPCLQEENGQLCFKKKIMILPVSLMPDVMKVGGLLRQKVLVTVRGVLPMCACERQTKAASLEEGREKERFWHQSGSGLCTPSAHLFLKSSSWPWKGGITVPLVEMRLRKLKDLLKATC